MLVHVKKPLRFSNHVTTFPLIEEQENIEMDSLENGDDANSNDEEESVKVTVNEDKKNIKFLNLNNINSKSNDNYVEEIVLSEDSIKFLPEVEALSLRSNGIHNFPNTVLQLVSLKILDISDNELLTLPPEISKLENLQELVLDQNLLSVLPTTIWDLRKLDVLKVACNKIVLPPDKHLDMRSLIFNDNEQKIENTLKGNSISTLNLRSNKLKGNIILGNYGNLVELDVSENNIEHLDLSAVEQLQILQCSRNSLVQLILHGKNLVSLIAGNNKLRSLGVKCAPINLRHLDVSFNELDSLPEWLSGCSEIRCIFASNNRLQSLPEHLFCNEMPYLHTIQLAYNQLQQLPTISRRLPIQELFLQNNSISTLSKTLFHFIPNVRVLNLSNNRLCDLPVPETVLVLEKLFLTANCLIDKSLERLTQYLRNLRILHASYNNFTSIPENCTVFWTEVEEIVMSGNKLLKLPKDIEKLKHLTVLRVHSNLLQNIPKLCNLKSLRVLDLAHNQLDHVDLTNLIPPNLKFLDLSCNTKLHVDSHQFNSYRTQRPMSLVDVSGKNRTSLPLSPLPFCENDLTDSSWNVGFSETSGCKQKLYISQIRLPAFCNTEGLFGMFDGENNNTIPFGVDKIVPRILLEERTVKETANDYMKFSLLSAHRELRDKGQKSGLNAIIVHIVRSKPGAIAEYSFGANPKKYTMKIASVGDIKLVLGRASGPVKLLPPNKLRKPNIRTNPQVHTVQDPDLCDVVLDEEYEYMIIANKTLWEVISPESAIQEVTLQRNVILAAKRLQDLAQSYGAEDNLSIIVVKFNLLSNDVDLLMRELRQTFRKTKYQSESSGFSSSTTTCQQGPNSCCCEAPSCEKLQQTLNSSILNEDRSSPSGQSEHNCSDCNSSAKLFINQLNRHNESRSHRISSAPLFESKPSSVLINPSEQRKSYRGVAKALRAKREEERNKDDSDSALSEEQFKCWEYMLEQNTQLLFDKELNTLNRNGKKGGSVSSLSLKSSQLLSRSNPHLAVTENGNNTNGFLSKQFGSARSFNPLVPSSKSSSRFTLDKKLLGGPHAAYFGSLQRLMPYNLEYDFAVMHERGLADSMDLDRMQQYWGVATTEL